MKDSAGMSANYILKKFEIMKIHSFSFFLIVLFVFQQSFSQAPENWTWFIPDTSSTLTKGLKFDEEGSIWMISNGKIIKYDGVDWIDYDFTDAGISLTSNYLRSFTFSNDQKVWCAGFDRVLEYDLSLDTLTLHDPGGNNGWDIAVDNENQVWWATGHGVYKYDGSTWTKYLFTSPPPLQINGYAFPSVKIDEENNRWLTTASSICFDGGCFTPAGVIKFSDSDTTFFYPESLGVPMADHTNLDFNANGDPILVVTEFVQKKNFILEYNNETWSTPVEIPYNGFIYDMKIANDDKLYLAFNDFIAVGDIQTNIWDVITPDSNYITGIYSLEVSEEGELYIAGFFAPPITGVLGYLPELNYKIRGLLYVDGNFNGIYDSTELTIKNQIIKTVDNSRTTFSNNSGDYSLLFSAPGTYSIEAALPPYFSAGTPPTGIHTVSLSNQESIFDNIDFGFEPDTTAIDLSIVLSALNNANPGFDVCYVINYRNIAPNITDAQIVCNFDSILTFQNSNPVPASINGNEITFLTGSLNWLEEGAIQICFSLSPDGGLIGAILNNNCTISPVNGIDLDPLNNIYSLRHTITGPLDPNDITVVPTGEGPQGEISRYTPYLEYTIRFQNVGSDTARNVVVSNPIDSNLNIYTINIIGYSHEFSIEYDDEKRLLNLIFEDINLVDSLTNEVESNGFLKYTIAPSSRETGLTITNYADIYFDFNQPIQTNKVTNTLVDTIKLTTLEVAICEGAAYDFNGALLTEEGIYVDSLTTSVGDSIVTLMLTVNPDYTTTIEAATCENDPYLFFGNTLSETGSYSATLQTIAGCDSTILLNLEVHPVYETILNVEIVEGESYEFGGQSLFEEGVYFDTLTTAEGCDSMLVLNLTVKPLINAGEAPSHKECDYLMTVNHGLLIIQFASWGNRTVSVFDLHGRRLEMVAGEQSTVSISLTELASGLYIILIDGQDCSQSVAKLFLRQIE